MTAYLPQHLLVHFKPGPPLKFLEQLQPEKHLRKYPGPMQGCSQYLDQFEDPKDTPAPVKIPTKEERLEAKTKARQDRVTAALTEAKSQWDPYSNKEGDAFKTIFVGRLAFEVTESILEKTFDSYGKVKSCHIVKDKDGKSRGYGFVEFEHEADMRDAYKHADGKKIEGKRIVVDVERGRTVQDWLPRRLGGGLGLTRKGPPGECVKTSGRVDAFREREDRYGDRDRERDRRYSRGGSRERDRDRSYRDRDRRDGDRRSSRDHGRDRSRRERTRSQSPRRRDRDRTRDRERDRRERERD